MVELVVGTYGVLCWLLFKKFKLIPINTYTICTAVLIGVMILAVLFISLSVFHPVGHDGRLYAPVVQIVTTVRGMVIEVPVEANQPIKKGDVLFRIDPVPFQIEVDRLRALLAGKNRNFALDVEALAAAEAATKEARAKLSVSESTNDRQLRETYERAKSQVDQSTALLNLANEQFVRAEAINKSGAGSQQEFDRAKAAKLSREQELSQVQADERLAKEKLKTGSASLEVDIQNLHQLESLERQARARVNTRMEGGKDAKETVTPEVRETMALLEKARWDLDQTVVRAPIDGYVPQQLLRPGIMATAIAVKPLMMLVVNEKPTLVASFQQKAISDIKPGLEAEVIFKAYPGRSFKVKVRRVLTAISEGELDASGHIVTGTSADEQGSIPVVFDYGDDIAELNLPVGSQASIAIYTERVHALSIVRKIILRMKSWENFVF